ncbi:MAG: YggS family pyridoxal phosphate-dependent enzyme [Nitriliruptorales bacterium]
MTTTGDIVGDIAARLEEVQERIDAACERAGRAPSSVTLVAVTKTHPAEVVRTLLDLGIYDIGENRVDEMVAKMADVTGARWHFVGRLQSNKARDVVGRAVVVHSVDRASLARALSRRAEGEGVPQRVLLQVNVGDDPGKGGCRPEDALDLLEGIRELPHLAVEGLMTIPPLPSAREDPAEAARPHFATLRELRDAARERWPEVVHLSMGMSADFEAAVGEGATIVRVGTALLGPRPTGPG